VASNSFLVKGWSVTLVSALVAPAISNKTIEVAILVFEPAVIFRGLDAYRLRQEGLFRTLYRHAHTAPHRSLEGEIFSMDTNPFCDAVSNLGPTMFNPTLLILHGCIVAMTVGMVIVVTGEVPGG